MVKNFVRYDKFLSFTVAATKTCKAIAFTCPWG